jgi:DNA-binding IclR family transcriptional regulator
VVNGSQERTGGGVTLETVNDALGALELLSDRGRLTVAEVARSFARSRSSAYRLVRTLVDRGWLDADGSGGYTPGPRTMQLGMRALGRAHLRDLARPLLERLSRETQETATVSVATGNHRVCLDQVESPRQIRMTVALGVAFPLYAGASGRAILSGMSEKQLAEYLDTVDLVRLTANTITDRRALLAHVRAGRRAGYVVACAERDPEAFSIASWVSGTSGVVGALAICGPMSRFPGTTAQRWGELVRAAAREISAALGGSSP